MNKCIGCGITLQNTDASRLGYTKKLDNLYCERCFKTIHYNEYIEVSNLDNFKIINKINKLGYKTFFITDFLNLNKDVINTFKRINNEKVLIVNKMDLLPKNLKIEHLIENIKESYKINDSIYFISGKKNSNLNKLIHDIEESVNVIFCGETSSGKSTLINNLVGSNLTTSKYNNTTLDFIKVKYLDYVIYDTPGLILESNKKNIDGIKVMTKQMHEDYVLCIDDLIINSDGNLTLYVDNSKVLNSKKSKKDNLKRIEIDSNSDIVFGGGFIFVKNKCSIYINKEIEVRNSIIGG